MLGSRAFPDLSCVAALLALQAASWDPREYPSLQQALAQWGVVAVLEARNSVLTLHPLVWSGLFDAETSQHSAHVLGM